jgi:hypothetical protein
MLKSQSGFSRNAREGGPRPRGWVGEGMAGIIRLVLTSRTIRKRTIPVGRQWSITRKGKEIGVQMMWSRQMPDGHLQICSFISKIH